MPYPKGHREQTRNTILKVAGAEFRKKGIQGIGLADIMKQAGLTHGGFYSHFSSKEDLVREAIKEHSPGEEKFVYQDESSTLKDIAAHYLRSKHRDHPENGCIAAALIEEIIREPKATRQACAEQIKLRIETIEQKMDPSLPAKERHAKAWAIFATLMGSLQLSRIVDDTAESESILQAGLQAACQLGE